jgi:nitric oxide reductase large subunit
MDIYGQIAEKIIEKQETIMGPVAVEQAEHVSDLNIDWANHNVIVSGDAAKAIDRLVEQYKNLFGQISVEVSKEAAASLLSELTPEQQPLTLV